MNSMEPLLTAMLVCIPTIFAGVVLYVSRQRIYVLWKRGFLPIPFTSDEAAVTAIAVGYAVCVLLVIWVSDPFVSGVLYFGSVQLGTLVLAIVRLRHRIFYTLLFCSTLYGGSSIRAIIHHRELGHPFDDNFFIVFGILFLFLVILPTTVASAVTFFRKDENRV